MAHSHPLILAVLLASLPTLRADDTKAGMEKEIAGIKLCWCPPGKFTMGSPRRSPTTGRTRNRSRWH